MSVVGEEWLDLLHINLIPVPLLVIDRVGNIFRVNNLCTQLLGYTFGNTGPHSITEIILPEDRFEFEKWISSIKERETIAETELRIRNANGEILVLRIVAVINSSAIDDFQLLNCILWDITSQKDNEKRLKANELKIEGLLKSTPDSMVIVDQNGLIIHVNDQLLQTFGYSPEELIGQNVELLIPDRFHQQHVHLRNKYVQNPKPRYMGVGLELHAKGKSGNEFPVEVSLNYQEISNEKYVLVVIRDISDRKIVEESLRESKERFMSAFQYAAIGMAIVSTEGKWIKVNKSVCQIVGYTEDELIGMTFQDITHPADLNIDLDNVNKMLRGEISSYQIEKRYIHKNGSMVWALLSVSLVHSEDDKPLYFISQIQDISVLKKDQNALKESEERFRLAAAGNGFGIWEWRNPPEDDFVSDTFCELIGYPREEIGRTLERIFELIHPDYQDRVQADFVRHLSQKQPFLSEFLLKKKNGDYAWFEVTGQAQFNDEGRAVRSVGYLIDITLRKQAVDRFKFLLNSSPDGIMMIDKEYRLAMINKQLSFLFGLDESEIIGKSILDFIPDFEKQVNKKKQKSEGNTKPPLSDTFFDSFIIQEGKEKVPVELAVNYLSFEEELTMIATVRDVTDRLQADYERKQILTALNATTDGIFMFDPKTLKHMYVNAGAVRQVGYTEEELLNMTPFDFKVKYSEESFRKILEPLLRFEKKSVTIETVHKHKNGNIFDVEVILQLAVNSDAAKTIVAVVRDISKRKLDEEALHLSEERFRALYENSTFGIYRTSPNGKIILANPALIKLLGFDSLEELQTRNLSTNGYVESSERLEFILQMKRYGKVTDMESVWLKKDGTPIFVRESARLIRDKNTGEHFYDGTVEDITDKKQAEADRIARQAAEAANKAKSIFLANMSHEIRTPLNSIIGFSELLSTSLKDPKSRSQADSIRTSGKNLLRIINDILDLSKIEAEKLILQTEPVDIHKFIGDFENIFRPMAKEKGISFFIEIEREISRALILDETRVRQIVFNLVGNAIKFTPEGNVILSVDIQIHDNEKADMLISVEDSGIGIPKEQQELIFEPFTQQEGQLEKKYGGTGLGLSITQHLVRMMGGEIKLTSEVGKGSIFTVTIPNIEISDVETSPGKEVVFDPTGVKFERGKILVVDDNVENRNLLRDYFAYSSLEIFEADEGSVAVALAKKIKPDVILMDLRMPGMNGVDATMILKADPETTQIPIIAVSASSKILFKDRFNSEVFNDFLVKPILFGELTEILKKYLKYSKIHSDNQQENAIISYGHLLNEEQKRSLESLTKELENKFVPACHDVLKKQEINTIEAFGRSLALWGETNSQDMVRDYGESICIFADNFEIDELMKKLQSFPQFVIKLKSALGV
jgi:PAS domain S-box-containing protein